MILIVFVAIGAALLIIERIILSAYWKMTIGRPLSMYNAFNDITEMFGLQQVGHKFGVVFTHSFIVFILYALLLVITYFTRNLGIGKAIRIICDFIFAFWFVLQTRRLWLVKRRFNEFCSNSAEKQAEEDYLRRSLKPNIVANRINFIYYLLLLILYFFSIVFYTS